MMDNGLTDEHTCQIRSICDWKLDLMAKTVLENVWIDRRAAVIEVCKILAQCGKESHQEEHQEHKRLEARAQKLKTRLQNLIEMRADGELSKEEFMSQKSEIAEQLQAIESQRTTMVTA